MAKEYKVINNIYQMSIKVYTDRPTFSYYLDYQTCTISLLYYPFFVRFFFFGGQSNYGIG